MKYLLPLFFSVSLAFAGSYTPTRSEAQAIDEGIESQKKETYQLLQGLLKKGFDSDKWKGKHGASSSLLGWVVFYGQVSEFDSSTGRIIYSLKSNYTLKIINLLLQHGANPNHREGNVYDVSPLNTASEQGLNSIFNTLINSPSTNVNDFAPELESPHFGHSLIMRMTKGVLREEEYERITPRIKKIFEKGFIPTGRNFDCEEWWHLTVHKDNDNLEIAKMFHSTGGMTKEDVGFCLWKSNNPELPKENECKYYPEECNAYFDWVGI